MTKALGGKSIHGKVLLGDHWRIDLEVQPASLEQRSSTPGPRPVPHSNWATQWVNDGWASEASSVLTPHSHSPSLTLLHYHSAVDMVMYLKIIEIKSIINVMLLNHLETIVLHPNLWKNYFPGNWSLVPKSLGISGLEDGNWGPLKSGQWMRFYDLLGASPVVLMAKNPHTNAGNIGSIPGLRRSPGKGHGNPPPYSCLENSMDGGAWQATVYGVTEWGMTEVT